MRCVSLNALAARKLCARFADVDLMCYLYKDIDWLRP